ASAEAISASTSALARSDSRALIVADAMAVTVSDSAPISGAARRGADDPVGIANIQDRDGTQLRKLRGNDRWLNDQRRIRVLGWLRIGRNQLFVGGSWKFSARCRCELMLSSPSTTSGTSR